MNPEAVLDLEVRRVADSWGSALGRETGMVFADPSSGSACSMSAGISRGRALVVAVIAAALGGVSFAVGVGSALGQRAERSILDAAEFTADPPAPLGLVSVWTVGGSIIVLMLLAWALHGFGRGLWFAVFASAAIVVSQLLKQRVLTRPELFDFDAPNTFPSGHMTVFTVLAGGLVWACTPRWRGIVGILAGALMAVVSWQLLAFGWHRPSDIVGALSLGVLALALAAVLRLPEGDRAARPQSAATATLNAIIGPIITLTGVALVLGAVIVSLWAASSRSDEQLLFAGQVGLVGASALTARTFMALAR